MQKKPLIALVALFLVVGVLGGTIAYFTSTATFNNEFESKPYSTKVTENFISPDNWTPGTTTDKTVNVQNTGEVPIAVRVKLEGKWTDSEGTELPSQIEYSDSQEDAAILNFDTSYTTNWNYSNGWYYYKTDLQPTNTTSDLLKSVQFNPHVVASANCVTAVNDVTCTSTGKGYDNAKYVLTITVETVQADVKATYWPDSVTA